MAIQVVYCLVLKNVNPFTAKDAIWRPEVITHTAICLTFANKYFYVSQHSMCLF